MLIIGELINTTRKSVREAVDTRSRELILQIARAQVEGGAHYLDVNCGNLIQREPAGMEWLVNIIQEEVCLPLCIDTPNPEVMEIGLSLARHGRPMVNSISAEEKRFSTVLPLIVRYKTKVIALCIEDAGVPKTVADRLRIADRLIADLTAAGVNEDDIYIDPLVKPLSTDTQFGLDVLETIRGIHTAHPEVHTICGLSNISYGLPNRRILNQTFMIQTMTAGMDAYILDPTDREMARFFRTSMALLGQDRYCANYLKAFRSGL